MFDGGGFALGDDVVALLVVAFERGIGAPFPGMFDVALRHIGRGVSFPFRLADQAAFIVVHPHPPRILYVVADAQAFAVELFQLGGKIGVV